MTTFIVGAHGQVGQRLTKQLAATGEHVIAGIRDDKQKALISQLGATPYLFDLTALPETMVPAFKDVDNVVFTAGSGGKTGDDATLKIDLDGAVKTMLAAEKAGIKRYTMVSALYTDQREKWGQTGIEPYYVAKYYADEWLQQRTQLNYTIFRPGALTNDAGTGKINLHPATAANKTISRDDVAAAIVAVLAKPQSRNHIYELVNGDTPIQSAF